MYYINKDKDRKGITAVFVKDVKNPEIDEDDVVFQIGYMWNSSYQPEASELIRTPLEALGERDLGAFKNSFCAKTSQADDIDARIEAAFDFFEGKPTFGWVKDIFGKPYNDGNHDFYHSELTDEVTIENYEPVSIYLEAVTVNIETDTGKKYGVEWSAYLLNDKEKEYEGILYLVITDGERRCAIGETPA